MVKIALRKRVIFLTDSDVNDVLIFGIATKTDKIHVKITIITMKRLFDSNGCDDNCTNRFLFLIDDIKYYGEVFKLTDYLNATVAL